MGEKVTREACRLVMLAIRGLLERNPMAVYDLKKKACTRPPTELSVGSAAALHDAGLLAAWNRRTNRVVVTGEGCVIVRAAVVIDGPTVSMRSFDDVFAEIGA